jgi:IclR family KDG regulon transcriptional repressor
MPYTLSTLDAGLVLLETIAEHPDTNLTELAKLNQLTKSQAFRLLFTLEQRGFIIKNATTRTYRLGYRPLYVGERAKEQTSLIARAQPFLDKLSAISQENVHLICREGLASVCVALSHSPLPLRLYAQVGRLGPLHAGGGSKVLLAFAPEEVRQAILGKPLERYTAATITDPERLRSVLADIVRDGFHVALSDVDENAFAISSPIRDHNNQVIAALSIAGPSYRLNNESLQRFRALAIDYSALIANAIR